MTNMIHVVHPNRICDVLGERFNIFGPPETKDGDWDLVVSPIEKSAVYIGCRELLIENKPWEENFLRTEARKLIEQGIPQWGHRRVAEFDQRESKIRELYESVVKYGICGQRDLLDGMTCYNPDGNFSDEINVAIGRHGHLFLFNGFHRTSIAKLLKLNQIPVRIARIHTQWEDFCKKTSDLCAKNWGKRLSYHPINHISFDSFTHQWASDRIDLIKQNTSPQHKTVLDIGSLFGYFCMQLEDVGFKCTATENYPPFLEVLLKIREAGHFKFDVFSGSALDVTNSEFDIIIAFNILHHFLKTQQGHCALETFLRRIKTKEMFVQLHNKDDGQMNHAYRNYSNDEFLSFISGNVGLTTICELGEEKGRKIFKLS